MAEDDAGRAAADVAASAPARTCTKCGCDLKYCSFCEREDCGAACCYGCMVEALGESVPALHAHGG